jgi:hypothetical protein
MCLNGHPLPSPHPVQLSPSEQCNAVPISTTSAARVHFVTTTACHTNEIGAGPRKTNRHIARYVSVKRASVRNRTLIVTDCACMRETALALERAACLNIEPFATQTISYNEGGETRHDESSEGVRSRPSIRARINGLPSRQPLWQAAFAAWNKSGDAAFSVADATQVNQFRNSAIVLAHRGSSRCTSWETT